MHIDNLLADMEAELPQYKTAGLMDRASMYRWTYKALKRFGQSICSLQEALVHVRNGFGKLPDNFHSLEFAVKCSPRGYHCNEEDKPVLQNSLIWKERVEVKTEWNSCDPCCTTESEKIITENTYINDRKLSFYYDTPIPLKLSKSVKRTFLADNCRNLGIRECPYEINIVETTLNTNFTEGTVFIQYYGIPTAEDGLPIIPDTPRGDLLSYIESYLYTRLYKKLLSNGDDVNIGTLYQISAQETDQLFRAASADARYMSLQPSSYQKVAQLNRYYMMRQEFLLPAF